MQVISARVFRASQTRFLTAARDGQSIVLTSRVGNFRIIPISSNDSIVEQDIKASMEEVKAHMEGRLELSNARDIKF